MFSTLRTIGLAEGLSFLILLLIAMPLKYIWGQPEAVRITGSLHGGLFVLYVILATLVAMKAKWPLKKLFYAYLASFLPLGTFVFDYKFLSKEH